jgi:hypothetical protein
MAIDTNIVNFGQSTPTADALSNLGGSVAGAINANKQSGLADNRRQAAGLLAQAFDDSSDEATTRALIEQARELDPEFTLATVQKVQSGASGLTSGQREFGSMVEGMSPEDQLKARRIKLGLDPRSVGSSSQTIAGGDTSQLVADSQLIIESGKAKGRATGSAEGEAESAGLIASTKSFIETAVADAKREAKDRGETVSDLRLAKAALPGLTAVVTQLKELAPIATSTIGGNVFDFASKEIGFGSTEGADAKAKFIAIISNQVLPLLKQTFGGAFSIEEGNSLKATFGDPDASPDQKVEQLNAFIESKIREIEGRERLLDSLPKNSNGGFTSKSGITFSVED